MDRFSCRACGFTQTGTFSPGAALLCPACGHPLAVERDIPEPPAADPRPTGSPTRRLAVDFTGRAGEYFRIWIVNLFLTIATLGVYAAWAKVRSRRYFCASTRIEGHPFDYTADPRAILRGNLIVVLGVLLYVLTKSYNPVASAALVMVFYALAPLLIFKSLQFFTRNTVYRNIRFGFHGSLGACYTTYLGLPLLIPFTLGLLYPYWAYARKRFFWGNGAFGTTPSAFSGRVPPFFKYYLVAGLLGAAVVGAALLLVGGLVALAAPAIARAPGSGGTLSAAVALVPLLAYVLLLAGLGAVDQFLYATVTNYCWRQTRLGRVRFESAIDPRRLIWIRITNLAAVIASLGLAIPWARVRRARYIVSRLTLVTNGRLEDFLADQDRAVTALGDAATDFFDFEVAL